MNKSIFVALLFGLFGCLTVNAQEVQGQSSPIGGLPRYGYLSYNAVFEQMPEYTQARADFAQLREKYEAEAVRAEEEFQRKFTEFLQGQKDFPKSILQKRQVELQELMERSVSFRKESQRLLAQAEAEMQKPVAERLSQAIQAVGAEQGLLFVLNTDGYAVPFVNPQAGIDITEAVLQKLTQQ